LFRISLFSLLCFNRVKTMYLPLSHKLYVVIIFLSSWKTWDNETNFKTLTNEWKRFAFLLLTTCKATYSRIVKLPLDKTECLHLLLFIKRNNVIRIERKCMCYVKHLLDNNIYHQNLTDMYVHYSNNVKKPLDNNILLHNL